MDRAARHLARRPLRAPPAPRQGARPGAAAIAGRGVRRAGLRAVRVVGARLEPPVDRVLPGHRRRPRWTSGRSTGSAARRCTGSVRPSHPVSLPARHGTLRPRRPPQRGQVLPLQRSDRWRRARRALRLRDEGPERRRRPRPGQPARRAGRDVQVEERRARRRAGGRHRRPRRRGEQGRRPRQPLPRRHPRGGRHRVRPAGLPRRRRPGARGPDRAPPHRRDRAGPGRPGDGREPADQAPEGGQGRPLAGRRGRRPGTGPRRAGRRHPRVPGRPERRGARAGCGRTSS